ncbi:ATP synthase delta chain, chloroplastic [Senna tora]|uniref:ATP synthase delta chain, chloroplastic n=1 Tax=Senna tora TaxID=362788 RepID=A0A834U2F1_9FABA|nr:ATP synthase delta chain, chloroplastic [Senna tora]
MEHLLLQLKSTVTATFPTTSRRSSVALGSKMISMWLEARGARDFLDYFLLLLCVYGWFVEEVEHAGIDEDLLDIGSGGIERVVYLGDVEQYSLKFEQ